MADWPLPATDPRVAYVDDHVLLLHCRWQDVIGELGTVDAIVSDPPYGERTHTGQRSDDVADGSDRRPITYAHWSPEDVADAGAAWSCACRGWMVALTSHDLAPCWSAAYREAGLTDFVPLPCLMPGMTVRLAGDGPSSWTVWCMVGRPKSLARWGTLPGGYTGPGNRAGSHIGGKPLWLMRALVSDYSREGDLILDPCAGAVHVQQRGGGVMTVEQQVDRLCQELEAFRNLPQRQLRADWADLYASDIYASIVRLGEDALPFLVDRIRNGEAVLNDAVCRISHLSPDRLTTYSHPTASELSNAILAWWEKRQQAPAARDVE